MMTIKYKLVAVDENYDIYEGPLPEHSPHGNYLSKEELYQIYGDVYACQHLSWDGSHNNIQAVRSCILAKLDVYGKFHSTEE